ncbi:hypothetical protein DL93DRAFT_2088399 [Clavulina sp. PMI_390]|nr:hypothetical protein DL93DRAFT_2088399 [Clavulina sp. PMI_390]
MPFELSLDMYCLERAKESPSKCQHRVSNVPDRNHLPLVAPARKPLTVYSSVLAVEGDLQRLFQTSLVTSRHRGRGMAASSLLLVAEYDCRAKEARGHDGYKSNRVRFRR